MPRRPLPSPLLRSALAAAAWLTLAQGSAIAQGTRTVLVLPVDGSSTEELAHRAYTDMHSRLSVAARQSGSFQNVIDPSYDTATQDQLRQAIRAGNYDSPVVLELGKQHNANTLIGGRVGEYSLTTSKSNDGKMSYTAAFLLTVSVIDVQTRTVLMSESFRGKTCTKPPFVKKCISAPKMDSKGSPEEAVNTAVESVAQAVNDFLSRSLPWSIVDIAEHDSAGAPSIVLVRVGPSGDKLRPGAALQVQREKRGSIDTTTVFNEEVAQMQVENVQDGIARCRISAGGAKLGEAIKAMMNGALAGGRLFVRQAQKAR